MFRYLAVDRPSVKLVSFLRKHYGLVNTIPQVIKNNLLLGSILILIWKPFSGEQLRDLLWFLPRQTAGPVQSDAKEGENLHGEAAIRLKVAVHVGHEDLGHVGHTHLGHVDHVDFLWQVYMEKLQYLLADHQIKLLLDSIHLKVIILWPLVWIKDAFWIVLNVRTCNSMSDTSHHFWNVN